MRIGIFGGSFDPPHRGHLAVALAAANTFALDRVQITPTGTQPLKRNHQHAPYSDRLAMTALLCQADPRLHASTLDQPHPGDAPNYTIDLINALLAQHPTDTLYNIIGADSFLDIRRWHAATQLLQIIDWIVVSRPGFSLATLAPLALTPSERQRIHLIETLNIDIAATTIRQQLEADLPTTGELTPPIAAYIAAHGLYRF